MDRFIVVFSLEAIKLQYPGWEEMKGSWERYSDTHWCLYETDGEKPLRLVGTDGGEPEDQLLVRDWRWVVHELNKLSQEIEDLKSSK